MKYLILLIFISLSWTSTAQDPRTLEKKTIKKAKETEGHLNDLSTYNNRFLLKREFVEPPVPPLYYDDVYLKTDIFNNFHSTQDDKRRFSLLYHFNPSLLKVTDISTFEGNLGFRRGISASWWEFVVARTVARFQEISDYGGVDPATDESLITAGFGLGYRWRLIQNIFSNPKLFDTTTVYLTYNMFSENDTDKTYQGFGLKADYGIHKRVSKAFQYEFKMSYNLASLVRDAEFDNESKSARSMMLSWISFAIGMSFYY